MLKLLSRSLAPTGAVLAALSLVAPDNAAAFAEDICYVENGGQVVDCIPLPEACEPVGTTTDACQSAALATFVQQGVQYDGGRSSFHTDVTHLLAQAAGFSAEHAYWIAAYDQATDLTVFVPRGLDSMPLPDAAAMTTATIDGYERTNRDSGGVLFHFHAPRNDGGTTPDPEISGLEPLIEDPFVEVFLAHQRAWAFTGSAPQCTAGLTQASPNEDLATGTSCYEKPAGDAAAFNGSIAVFEDSALPIHLVTGRQIVATDAQPGGEKTSEAFDTVIGTDPVGQDPEHLYDARIGIYVHALADRVSHHVCTDRAVFSGPGPQGAAFGMQMDNPDCTQPSHALRHMWEQGVDFSVLDGDDRTTEHALELVYDELMAFAEARGTLHPDAASRKELVLEGLLDALATTDAQGRLLAIAAVACELSLKPFPGLPSCATSEDAQSATTGATASAQHAVAATDSSGCTAGGTAPHGRAQPFAALALLASLALGLRRAAARTARSR